MVTICNKNVIDEMIDDLIQNDYSEYDIRAFIEDFGTENFYLYFEEFHQLSRAHGYDAVGAFVEEYGIERINEFEDRYVGFYDCFLQFSNKYFYENYGYMINDVVFNYVDFDKFERDLAYSYDYVDGYVFARDI